VEARALTLATLQERVERRVAIVVPGDEAIDDFEAALRLFCRGPKCVSAYPSPSLSPYQDLAPSLGVVRNEIRALGMLIDRDVEVLIVPARALFSRLRRPEDFAARIVRIAEGDELEMGELLERIVENGFVRTDLVGEAGECAFRGGILDLFPPNTAKPVRVELFGDTIDSRNWFDVETQRSEDESGAVSILPMTQVAVTKPMRTALASRKASRSSSDSSSNATPAMRSWSHRFPSSAQSVEMTRVPAKKYKKCQMYPIEGEVVTCLGALGPLTPPRRRGTPSTIRRRGGQKPLAVSR
ncbi:MAG: hypothetical protein ACRD3J_26555, partial [Thermoanaerobaculia bacterium]